MFPYRLTDPNTLGQVTRWDVPINRWLGVKFEQGLNDRGGAVLGRMTEDLFADGPEISPQEANEKYGLPTLKFDAPIREERARLMHERKRAELARLAYMEAAEHSWFSPKAVAGFGAQLLGGILHPVDMAAMFVPVVGSSIKAGGVAKLGGGAFRQAMARGLVTRETLAEATRFPQFTAAFIEGTVGNAILEVPLFVQNMRDQAIYGPEDSAVNILAGGLFAGGVRMAISGLGKAMEAAAFVHRRVSPEVREAMFREAANQFLRDEDIKVHEYVNVDDEVIRQRVVFDEAKARQEAEAAIPEVRVVSETDIGGTRVTVTEENIRTSLNDAFKRGEESVDAISALRQVAEKTSDPALRARIEQKIQEMESAEAQPKPQDKPAPMREQAIGEFIARKRAEFEANKESLVAVERRAEVARQQAQGKILPDEEITRLVTDDPEKAGAILDEDVATLEQDLKAEAKRRTTQDMSPEEKEMIQRELDDELGQVEETLYQPRDKAIQAAIDCVIENASKT